MAGPFFHAAAVDYDGTLTLGGRPRPDVLNAIADTRAAGRRVVLVTGRILEELRAEFPDLAEHFDAIVGENGAVLFTPGRGERPLAAPVAGVLGEALTRRGIPHRCGRVILAVDGGHEAAVLEETRQLGLEVQLVRNRGALMVTPPGISKGHGLHAALGVLGISYHNAVAFGDAENDHSLLEECELGIAVGNAVAGLKARADVVLAEPGGDAVARFLRGPVMSGELRITAPRRSVEIGRFRDGFPAVIPSSQSNVLIAGATATGKSWLAGLFAERLIEAEYSVVVLDPEGDHPGLGRLRGVATLSGLGGAAAAEAVRGFLRHRFGSVVVDLSMEAVVEKHRTYAAVLDQLDAQRRESGVPQWIFLDEAQLPAAEGFAAHLVGRDGEAGYCLITWHPRELRRELVEETDYVMLTSALDLDWLPDRFHRDDAVRELAHVGTGDAVLLKPGPDGWARAFHGGHRSVEHIRHWHKYVTARLPEHRQFRFAADGVPTGRAAANVAEFHHELARAPEASILFHARRADFSRWLGEVIRDEALAAEFRALEARWPLTDAVAGEAVRAGFLDAIRSRYLREGGAAAAR